MLLKQLTFAAASCAVAAEAFLLPPELSDADVATVNSLPVEVYTVPDYMLVNLTCPGCPVMSHGRHGSPKIKTNKASHLELGFSVSHELDFDRLFVNGFELYPSVDTLHNVLNAPLVRDHVHREHKNKNVKHHKSPAALPLGFGLEIRPVAHSDGDELQIIDIDLQIVEVGEIFVQGIPNVRIQIVKDSNGRLAIGNIETTESQTVSSTPTDKQEECTTMLCKWIAIAKDKLSHFKSGKHCGGMMGAAIDDSHSNGHGEHHRPHIFRHHRWGLLFKNIAAHILLPVAIGIVAGVAVSLVGMAVGTFIVTVYRTLYRRKSRRHGSRAHHRAAHREAAAVEEKSSLIASHDPPSYDDVVVVGEEEEEGDEEQTNKSVA